MSHKNIVIDDGCRTKAKITMNDKDFKAAILKEINEENLPVHLGGKFSLYNEPYEFDLSETSPFYDRPPMSLDDIIAGQQATTLDEIGMEQGGQEDDDEEEDTWLDSHHNDADIEEGADEAEGEVVIGEAAVGEGDETF